MNRPRLLLVAAGGVLACVVAAQAGKAMFTSYSPSKTPPRFVQIVTTRTKSVVGTDRVSANVPSPHFADKQASPPHVMPVTPPVEMLPRLSGIVISRNVGHAIFEHDGNLRDSVVGDHLGAYHIIDIAPTTVTIQGPQGVQALHPDSDGGNTAGGVAGASAGTQPPSLLDQLHTQPPPVVPMPRPPSLTQMLSRLPRSH